MNPADLNLRRSESAAQDLVERRPADLRRSSYLRLASSGLVRRSSKTPDLEHRGLGLGLRGSTALALFGQSTHKGFGLHGAECKALDKPGQGT